MERVGKALNEQADCSQIYSFITPESVEEFKLYKSGLASYTAEF
jgi:hypothetical protein